MCVCTERKRLGFSKCIHSYGVCCIYRNNSSGNWLVELLTLVDDGKSWTWAYFRQQICDLIHLLWPTKIDMNWCSTNANWCAIILVGCYGILFKSSMYWMYIYIPYIYIYIYIYIYLCIDVYIYKYIYIYTLNINVYIYIYHIYTVSIYGKYQASSVYVFFTMVIQFVFRFKSEVSGCSYRHWKNMSLI